ncbi:hypothetical protein BDR22DRAFT_827390 [Usnea florida]
MDPIPSCSAEVLVIGGNNVTDLTKSLDVGLGINWCWTPTSTRMFATVDLDILVQNAGGVGINLHYYQSLNTSIPNTTQVFDKTLYHRFFPPRYKGYIRDQQPRIPNIPYLTVWVTFIPAKPIRSGSNFSERGERYPTPTNNTQEDSLDAPEANKGRSKKKSWSV